MSIKPTGSLPQRSLPQVAIEKIYAFSDARGIAALQKTCAWLQKGWALCPDNAYVHSRPSKGKIDPSRIEVLGAGGANILVLDLFEFGLRDLRNLFRSNSQKQAPLFPHVQTLNLDLYFTPRFEEQYKSKASKEGRRFEKQWRATHPDVDPCAVREHSSYERELQDGCELHMQSIGWEGFLSHEARSILSTLPHSIAHNCPKAERVVLQGVSKVYGFLFLQKFFARATSVTTIDLRENVSIFEPALAKLCPQLKVFKTIHDGRYRSRENIGALFGIRQLKELKVEFARDTAPYGVYESYLEMIPEGHGLEMMHIHGILPSGLGPLARLPHLHSLSITNSESIRNLSCLSACKSLRSLALRHFSQPHPNYLSTLLRTLATVHQLEALTLEECEGVDDLAFAEISKMPGLEDLRLVNHHNFLRLTDQTPRSLSAAKKLRELEFGFFSFGGESTIHLTTEGMTTLARSLPELRRLDFRFREHNPGKVNLPNLDVAAVQRALNASPVVVRSFKNEPPASREGMVFSFDDRKKEHKASS